MYLVSTFSNPDLNGKIYYEKLVYTIKGKFEQANSYTFKYWAAAPGDLRLSYSGSGLPFASEKMAYYNTPNQGHVTTNSNGEFEFQVWAPNSYYICQGITLIPPQIHIYVENLQRQYTLALGAPIPNRSLRHLDGRPNRTYGR